MATCTDYLTVTLTGWLYSLTFFFRGSVAPITDVFEAEYNASSSQIGLMSSLFWLSYFILQLPMGMLIQKVQTERVMVCTAFLFAVTSGLFGMVKADSILFPGVFMLLCGILAAPCYLCFASLVAKRFSNSHLATYGGVMNALNSIILVSGNMLQAFLYQNFGIWRPIYWVVAAMTFVVFALMLLFNFDRICGRETEKNYGKCQTKQPDLEMVKVNTIDIDDTVSTEIEELASPVSVESVSPAVSVTGYEGGEEHAVSVVIDDETDKEEMSLLKKFKLVALNPFTWVLAIHQFCVNTIQYSFNGLWAINYMRFKYDIDRETSTMISSSFWIAFAVGVTLIGKLASRYKKRKIIYFLTMIFIFVPPSVVIYGPANMPLIVIYLCNIISGLGMGIVAVTFVVIREYHDANESSDIAVGFMNSVSVSAGFITQYAIGLLTDYHLGQRGGDDGVYEVSDYNFGLMIIPIVGVVGIICSILVKETNGKTVYWGK